MNVLFVGVWRLAIGVHILSLLWRAGHFSPRSAMCSELPTATFLILPNWENKSINAYRALVRDNPKYCTTLSFIPKTKLLSTRRSILVLGGECNRTSVSTLLAQLALC